MHADLPSDYVSTPELVEKPVLVSADGKSSLKHRPHRHSDEDVRETDCWIYRILVGALGLVVILSVIGMIILGMIGSSTPEGLVALGSAAVGALAGLLIPPAHR